MSTSFQSPEAYSFERTRAREFLQGLEGWLNQNIPPRTTTRKILEDVVKTAKGSADKRQKQLAFPEGAFLNKYGIPLLHDYLIGPAGLSTEAACQALLSESYRHHKDVASDSPASTGKHPFTKLIGHDLESIVSRWWDPNVISILSQSCPDLALRDPCPHKIVFEAKYFREGSPAVAKSTLVRDIYQCFFYLGLPHRPSHKKRAAWDYDYASLLAFDATPDGVLVSAWRDINSKLKDGLWDGANIFVMVLGRAD
jgi:hypothetical protein